MDRKSSVGVSFQKVNETDLGDNTKVIVRTFDMPTRSVQQPSIIRTPLMFCKQKERWKYQHNVDNSNLCERRPIRPNVKSITRVYPGRKSKTISESSNSSHQSASVLLTQAVRKKISNSEMTSLMHLTGHNDRSKVMVPEHSVVFLAPTVVNEQIPKVVLQSDAPIPSEKITLNNLPDNIIGNSVQVVNSKIVDGKKILYFKALKDLSKPLSKLDTISPEKSISIQGNVLENLKIDSQKNMPVPGNSVAPVSSIPPLTYLSNSTLASLLLAPSQSKQLPSVEILGQDSARNNSTFCLKLEGGLEADSSSTVCVGAKSVVPTKIDSQQVPGNLQSKSLIVLDPGLIAHSDSQCNNKSNPNKHVMFHINEVLSNQPKAMELKTAREKSSLPEDKEKTVYFEVIAKPPNQNLYLTSNQNVPKPEVSESPNLKRKIVMADSTTSLVASLSESSSSEKQLRLIHSSDSQPLVNFEKGSTDDVLIDNQVVHCDICPTSPKPDNELLDAVVAGRMESINSKLPSNSKQNGRDAELYRRRQQIALQFQQDTLKARSLPRSLRTVQLPAREVHFVDVPVQTDLFSLLEPGRMVEMHVEEPANGSGVKSESLNSTKSTVQVRPHISTVCEVAEESTNKSMDKNNYNLRSRLEDVTDGLMNTIPAKRMCVEKGENFPTTYSSNDNLQSCNSNVSCGENVEKEMDTTSERNKFGLTGNAKQPENVNEKIFLACKKFAKCNAQGFSDSDVLRFLVERMWKDYKSSLKQDGDGNIPIHFAVIAEDVEQVRKQCFVLRARKQSVDIQNFAEETPLHLAMLCQNSEIAQELLHCGADPSISDGKGNTAIHMAISRGDLSLLLLLIKNLKDGTSSLDKPNDEGYSPLHLCTLSNKEHEAMILVKNGANINIRDRKSGRTPLFHAVERGFIALSRKLIEFGASTTIANFSGQIPLNASESNIAGNGFQTCAEELLMELFRGGNGSNEKPYTSKIVDSGTNINNLNTNSNDTSDLPLSVLNRQHIQGINDFTYIFNDR